MNSKGYGRKSSRPDFLYYNNISLDDVGKTRRKYYTKYLIRDMNSGPQTIK